MVTKSSNTTLALTLDEADVAKIIDATVQAQVAMVLSQNGANLVQSMVSAALFVRKDSYGHNSTDKRHPTVLETVVNERIKAVAIQAVKDWFEQHREVVTKEISKQLSSNRVGIAEALIGSLTGLIDSSYRLNVNLTYSHNNKE